MENKSQCMIMALVKITCLSFSPLVWCLLQQHCSCWILSQCSEKTLWWLIYTVSSLRHSQVTGTVSFPSWIPDICNANPRVPLWLPFFSLQHCFFGKLLVGSSQFWQAVMVSKGVLWSTMFVLQEPCSFLQRIREFYSFWVWHYSLGHLSLFAVMLNTFSV